MKRILILVLVLLAACVPQVAEQPDTYRVAFLMADSPSDGGWNAAHYRGIEALRELGEVIEEENLSFTVDTNGGLLEVRVVDKVGYNEGDIERVAQKLVDEGYQHIFGTWWDSRNVLANMAEKYPDVIFEHCSGYPFVQSNGSNFSTYFVRQEQGDYVAGYVTALMGYESVGLVGTYPIPEPVRALNAYTLGGRAVTDDFHVHVVWIWSWLNRVDEITAAESLIAEGYPVIRQLADTPYSSQAACDVGRVAVGYGTDVSDAAPCALVTNEWNWAAYYVPAVKSGMAGTWEAQDWWAGFEAGAIKMVGWNVPHEVRDKAEALIDKFETGRSAFQGPFTGYGKDGFTIEVPAGKAVSDMSQLTMQWYADGLTGEQPDEPETGYDVQLTGK